MSLQPETILAAVKQANPIVSLVAEYLPLHRSGNSYKALCPFHDDHKPSLTLNSDRQSYKCWSCGAGGDVFDFVMAIDRVDFPEALSMLAERAGIVLEKESHKGDGPKGPSRSDLFAACAWAESAFSSAYFDSMQAQDYSQKRGISAESIDRFKIGFAPDSRDWLSMQGKRAGFGMDVLEAAGLIGRKEGTNFTWDRFRGRLIFPIHDIRSRAIAFGGRILPELEKKSADEGLTVAKYLNSPDTTLFHKREILFAADLARAAAKAAGWVAVVEGYTDVIAAHQAGLENVVGVLGTALGDDHIPVLRSLADRVVLILDGDEAGQRAADRSLELFLGHEVDVRVLTLPDGLDPADFLARRGGDAFRFLVERAIDPLEFIIDRAAGRYDLHSVEGARLAGQWVLSILAKVPKGGRGGLDLKVAKALDTLSRRLGVPIADLKRELRRSSTPRTIRSKPEPVNPTEVSEREEVAAIDPASLDPLDREVLRIAMNEPDSVAILQRVIPSDALREAPLRAILQTCYDLLAEGEPPEFDRVSLRLSNQERALAAGLLMPIDPTPMPEGLRPASWLDRLHGVLRSLEWRRWEDRQRDLLDALREIDPISEPVQHQALRAEYLKHLTRRPSGPKPK